MKYCEDNCNYKAINSLNFTSRTHGAALKS